MAHPEDFFAGLNPRETQTGLDASFIVNTLIASAAQENPRKQEGMTTMTKKRIAIAAVAALSICAGAYGIASANFGHHGHGGPGGGVLFLLARAGGITHQQIWTALQATTIKADITQLKTDQAALYQCIATSNNCSASAYLADKAKVEADKTNAIVGLLNGVQSRTNISNVYNQLQTVKQAQQTLKGMLPHPQWGPQSQGTNGDTPSTPE